jgi:hypothetical protein
MTSRHRAVVLVVVGVVPGVVSGAACIELESTSRIDTVVQTTGTPWPNARRVEGNASPIDANGNPIDANGSPIDANSRRIDGVGTRGLGINDLLTNALVGKSVAIVDAAQRQGWYLPDTTDLFVEGYPAGFPALSEDDRCLALAAAEAADPAAAVVPDAWRIAPSRAVGAQYVESGVLELGALDPISGELAWGPAPHGVDLYLPATAAPALVILAAGPSAVPAAARRPVLFRWRVVGPLPVRDPTDLLAETVDRTDGRMYRKQLIAAAFCLPDPADAAVASWISIGAVAVGDGYAFDVAASSVSAQRADGDGIAGLAPWLRFKGYIGRDPGDTSAKAEMYYTGGLVSRGDPALEPRLVCASGAGGEGETAGDVPPPLPPPPMPAGPTAPEPMDPTEPTEPDPGSEPVIVPVAELDARIAAAFANAIDVVLDGDDAGTALPGLTVTGTKIRVSYVTRPGCELVIPAALTSTGADTAVDWLPSEEELAIPAWVDSIVGAPEALDAAAVVRSRNTTACGPDERRAGAWVAAAPEDDGVDVPPRARIAERRAARCDAVWLVGAASPAPDEPELPLGEHAGRFTAWHGADGIAMAPGLRYSITAWADGEVARCGDWIFDREVEAVTCPFDEPPWLKSGIIVTYDGQ